jgi:hypothetical protein
MFDEEKICHHSDTMTKEGREGGHLKARDPISGVSKVPNQTGMSRRQLEEVHSARERKQRRRTWPMAWMKAVVQSHMKTMKIAYQEGLSDEAKGMIEGGTHRLLRSVAVLVLLVARPSDRIFVRGDRRRGDEVGGVV